MTKKEYTDTVRPFIRLAISLALYLRTPVPNTERLFEYADKFLDKFEEDLKLESK